MTENYYFLVEYQYAFAHTNMLRHTNLHKKSELTNLAFFLRPKGKA